MAKALAQAEPGIDAKSLFRKLKYEPHSPAQWEFSLSQARFNVPCCGRRWGKQLSIDTPILTPHGFKTMGELQAGDLVFDEQGQPTTVTHAHPIELGRPCYLIKFNDDSEIIADAEHEWFTWDKAARKAVTDPRRHTQPELRTTAQIAKTLLTNSKNPEPNHAIQVTQPIQFITNASLPIDPYVLGVWLGDGSSHDGSITCHHDDLETLARVEDAGFEVHTIESHKYLYRVEGLTTLLKQNSLLQNKHIPQEYMYASVEQRSDLLAGLMDTDGTIGTNGQIEFSNTNEDISLGAYWLCVSLGMIPKIHSKLGTLNGKTYKKVWRVRFMPNRIVFKLDRKVRRQITTMSKGRGLNRHLRYIKSCEPIESVPVRCISVDSPSRLYLAGHTLIPTHNSQASGHRGTYKSFIPDAYVWIVGPTYRLAEKEFRVIYDDYRKLEMLKYCRKSYSPKQGNMRIETPWHSVIEAVSADNQDSLLGEGLTHAIMSEAAKHSVSTWEQFIEPALSDLLGSADFPSTPKGFNWFHGLFELGQNSPISMNGQLLYQSWHLPSWTNPIRYPGGYENEEIQRIKDRVSKLWFDQEYGALFTAMAGSIYEEFDRTKHVYAYNTKPFNPAWPNFLAFDYGFANPFVALDIQISPSDDIYVWREYYLSGKSTYEHGQYLKQERPNPPGYHVDGMWGDPRGADEAAILALVLGHVASQDVPWKHGVEEIKRFLKPQADGFPKIFISDQCPNLIRQMGQLHVKETKTATSQDIQEMSGDHNIQQKVDDHAADALRYFIGPYYVLGAGSHLEDVYGQEYLGSESQAFSMTRLNEQVSLDTSITLGMNYDLV